LLLPLARQPRDCHSGHATSWDQGAALHGERCECASLWLGSCRGRGGAGACVRGRHEHLDGWLMSGPLVNELFDEAFERAGIDVTAPGTVHLKGAFRSLRTMLNSEWSTLGIRQWQIAQAQSHTVAVGEVSFLLPLGQIDITEAVLRRPGSGATPADVEMYPITRQEYTMITNKTVKGRPDRYFVDRQFAQKVVYYWQAGSNTTDQIIYNAFHQNQ